MGKLDTQQVMTADAEVLGQGKHPGWHVLWVRYALRERAAVPLSP